MHKLLRATILIILVNNLIAQPLRFYDKADTVKYTSLDAVGDDKGGWLTLGSAEDSSFFITQFDYCGKIIVNEKYALPANTKLHTPQMTYSGKDTLIVAATLASASDSRILIFYSVGGIISKAKLISTGASSINSNPVISVHNPTHILLAFNYNRNGLAKSRIVMLDRNLNQRWSKHIEAESNIRWIKMLSDTTFAIGDGLKVRKFDTLGNNLWSRIFPVQQMVYNSVLKKDTQLVFLTDYIESDTSVKTKFKQVIGLDVDGKLIWQSNRIRSMRSNSLLEYNSRLFFDNKKSYVFNAVDTVNGDPIPALFAHTLDGDGNVVASKYWSARDSVIDYKSTLLNDGNFGVCISLGTSDTLKGLANIKSTQTYQGACETKEMAILGGRSVFMDPINTERLRDSNVSIQPLNILGRADSMKLNRLCEVFDLKDGEVPVPLCKGDSVFLAGIQLPNATFDWFNGSKEPGVFVKEAGDYSVKITYCDHSITITYKVSYLMFPDSTFAFEQCNYPDMLYAFQGPNIKGASYIWDNGSTESARSIDGPGTYKVTVTYCQFPFVQTFVVSTPKFNDEIIPFQMCDYPNNLYAYQGPNIKGATYKWDNGSTNGAREITGPGTYKVTVNYCLTSFVQTFVITRPSFKDETIPFTMCEYSPPQTLYAYQGQDIHGATYKWDDGSTNAFLKIDGPGSYKVTVNYCNSSFVQTFKISLDVLSMQNFTIMDTCKKILEKGIDLYAFYDDKKKGIKYSWKDTALTSPYLKVFKPGTYVVNIEYCMNDYTQSFTVKEKEEDYLKFPNVFLPNSDIDENTSFKPVVVVPDTTQIKDYHLEVFNRWGQSVFSSNEPNKGWDGNYDGDSNQPAPMETYMYVATINSECGVVKGWKGTVTLIR